MAILFKIFLSGANQEAYSILFIIITIQSISLARSNKSVKTIINYMEFFKINTVWTTYKVQVSEESSYVSFAAMWWFKPFREFYTTAKIFLGSKCEKHLRNIFWQTEVHYEQFDLSWHTN